jgi:hypothetical protein
LRQLFEGTTLAERLAFHSWPLEDGCLLWTARVARTGYGMLTWEGKVRSTHRMAWIAEHGPIPEGMHVLHHCDVRHCIATAHLFLGTHRDNMADRNAKGRQARGEMFSFTKLTEAQVREIRSYPKGYPAGTRLKDLESIYGVYRSTIRRVRRGEMWAHLAPSPAPAA